jgi:hypothetical protein
MRPRDGQIAVFTAAAGGPMTGPTLACAGRTDGDGTQDLLRTAALRADGSRYVLGDLDGKLFDFALAACPDWSAPAAVTLGSGAPITDVESAADGTLAVTQAAGKAYIGTIDALAAGTATTVDTCAYPLGALSASGRHVVACYAVSGYDPMTEATPASVPYDRVSLQVVDAGASGPSREIAVDLDRLGSVAVDGDAGAMFEVRDSALGILRVTTLSDGASHERKGLFLGGILD